MLAAHLLYPWRCCILLIIFVIFCESDPLDSNLTLLIITIIAVLWPLALNCHPLPSVILGFYRPHSYQWAKFYSSLSSQQPWPIEEVPHENFCWCWCPSRQFILTTLVHGASSGSSCGTESSAKPSHHHIISIQACSLPWPFKSLPLQSTTAALSFQLCSVWAMMWMSCGQSFPMLLGAILGASPPHQSPDLNVTDHHSWTVNFFEIQGLPWCHSG